MPVAADASPLIALAQIGRLDLVRALFLDLPVIGTLGVLLEAKHQGLLPEIGPELGALRSVNFFMAPSLIEQVLAAAGES